MVYDSNALLELRNRLDLREIVAETLIAVSTQGKSWKFHCPFHDDRKKPNFFVYTDGYQCYSCMANGTIFHWFGHTYKISFQEAVKMVEQRAGIALETEGVRGPALKAAEYQVIGLDPGLRDLEGSLSWISTVKSQVELLIKRAEWLLSKSITEEERTETRLFLREIREIANRAEKAF